jgi:hypothetical protein
MAAIAVATAARVTARLGASLRRGAVRRASRKPLGRHAVLLSAVDKDGEQPESRLRRMLKVKPETLSRKDSDALAATLRDLKLDTPAKLRGFLLKGSSVRALLLLSDVGINAIGAVCAYASFKLLVDNAASSVAIDAVVKYVLAAVAAFSTGWFTTSIAGDVIVLITTLVAATRFGLSADGFLALAGDEGAPRLPRSSPVDSARAAHAALASAGKLEKAMSALQAMQAIKSEKSDLSSSLAAYLALASAEEQGFKADALALSKEDVQAVSRAFSACDKDGDGELNVSELRALLADMTGEPCSPEDAETCMRALDTVGNSRLNFEAFARWWAEVKAIPTPEQQQQ